MSVRFVSSVARWVFGLWYLVTGASWLVSHGLGRGTQHREIAAGAIAFQKALTESGFMDPLLALTCLFGGTALLIPRIAPLGIAMLAPIVVVIFFFHVMLSGHWIWGAVNLIWLAGLAWEYRKSFTPLWSYVKSKEQYR